MQSKRQCSYAPGNGILCCRKDHPGSFRLPKHETWLCELGFTSLLVQTPSLMVGCRATKSDQAYQDRCEKRLDPLMHKTSTMFHNIKDWLIVEAEPFHMPRAPSSHFSQDQTDSPDVIYGVSDSVANTALLTLDAIYRSLYRAKLRSSIVITRSEQQWMGHEHFLNNLEDTERRRWRGMRAFR